jgi:trimethylamine-N-oxide reductase (cytochrome c)
MKKEPFPKPSSKTTDKSVVHLLGMCPSLGANTVSVDVKDGRIARIRPLHYDTVYTEEELNAWKIEAKGKVFEPGMKTLPSPFCIAYKHRAYSANRIPYPMKRVDWDPNGERNPKNRGQSKFVRVSWDEALGLVASEIYRIQHTYGPSAILLQGDGHGENKVVHACHGGHMAMMNLIHPNKGFTLQARNSDSWEGWYWGGKYAWGMEPIGSNSDQNNCIRDVSLNSDAVFFWGCDPETTPMPWGGEMPSRICFWFSDIGVKSIHIAPEVNYTNACHADKWIPVWPNTDAALQCAIAYVWMTEGTVEKEYLETHAVGYDWFEYYILGNEDGIAKTPEWAAEKCGIPSYRIKALARYWASHKISIAHCNGGGMIRSAYSHEPARLEIYLLGMRGVGQPGVNQFKFIEWSLFGMDTYCPLPLSSVRPSVHGAYHGRDHSCLPESFIPKTLIHDAILRAPIEWYGHTTCVLPREDQFNKYQFPIEGGSRLHMIWSDTPCWSTCWNNSFEFQDAVRDESIETIVIQHPWFENDCLFADILLPVSVMLELDDINADNCSGQFSSVVYVEHAIEPVAESRSDYIITLDVAEALEKYGEEYENLRYRRNGDLTVEDWIKRGYMSCGAPEEDLDYEKFKEQKFQLFPTKEDWESDPPGMLNFYNDPESFPLQTPSGLLEYYSTDLAENFPDDDQRGPVAHWVESDPERDERRGGERAKLYPYLCMSNHPRWREHANMDDLPWLREIETCKMKGPDGYLYEPIWINPHDAEHEGLEHGDIAVIYNERGSVMGAVYATERIMEGALYQDHGSRTDPIVIGAGGLDRGGANNLLCTHATTSQNCAGEITNSFLVGIKKVDVFELAKQYPEAFSRKYDAAYGIIPDSYILEEGGEQL